ncbi:thioesterase superfamily protein [Parvibaculum lavamentivorans DS-1]|uniref:Thioesterase superfamily protein n=1 Tax=Parvibaculum lavamentivorans (strain DS-1 / DSM 13023 / NCIMB 13966) TaxID=402881 RepID=A7HXB0_PARL1|nr:PaaI family thioesterase [Parvibaculum lavamentivorans]ABS64543.1 thioesterase superfamily protein [Parvibaculum lavamentivorans DS-1]
MADLVPVMSVGELEAFMEREFPQMRMGADTTRIEAVGPGTAVLRLGFSERNLRPGGTISGPAMMALADYAMYAAVLAHIGPVGLAVTTNLSINFLRKPGPADIIGEARLLKLGRALAVGEIAMWQDGAEDAPVAHAVSTYSIPPK